jgi:hypothetical protein
MSNQQLSIVSYRASRQDLTSVRHAIDVRMRRLQVAAANEARGVRPTLSDIQDLIEVADLEKVEARLSR